MFALSEPDSTISPSSMPMGDAILESASEDKVISTNVLYRNGLPRASAKVSKTIVISGEKPNRLMTTSSRSEETCVNVELALRVTTESTAVLFRPPQLCWESSRATDCAVPSPRVPVWLAESCKEPPNLTSRGLRVTSESRALDNMLMYIT